jgi:hypothetical protein
MKEAIKENLTKSVSVQGRAMLMSAHSSIIAIKFWNQKQKQIKM